MRWEEQEVQSLQKQCLQSHASRNPATGEISQRLRALAALPDRQGSVPSTHIGQLTTACNSRSRGSITLLQSPSACTHGGWAAEESGREREGTHTCTNTHTNTNTTTPHGIDGDLACMHTYGYHVQMHILAYPMQIHIWIFHRQIYICIACAAMFACHVYIFHVVS